MPTVTTHALGTFSWPELGTTDQNAAKKFYGSLFGWEFVDNDMGPNGVYTIFTLRGKDVAALYTLMPDMVKNGVPPFWGSYVTVENADQAAEKAKTLGGKLIMGPMDVMDHGRMAVLQDPQGAVFTVWQAKSHIGVSVLNEPGALAWTQLNAKDPAGAKKFYPALLGWKIQDNEMPAATGGGMYTTFLKSDGPAAGMMPMPGNAPAPSHWLPYFAVADVDASATKAKALGGQTYVPPTDIPGMGRFAVLADAQGATFAIVKFTAPA
jgi:predicted enzyme related to lactoylglutathione lyase